MFAAPRRGAIAVPIIGGDFFRAHLVLRVVQNLHVTIGASDRAPPPRRRLHANVSHFA